MFAMNMIGHVGRGAFGLMMCIWAMSATTDLERYFLAVGGWLLGALSGAQVVAEIAKKYARRRP